MIDFIVLPARARISVAYTGEHGGEGFISLKRLWIIFIWDIEFYNYFSFFHLYIYLHFCSYLLIDFRTKYKY
jgi:hypothetical protein